VVKVAKVETFFIRYRYPSYLSYRFAAGLVENLDAALVRVTADNGEYGLGEVTFGTHTYEPVLGVTAHFNRVLEGFPVREINRAWETMYQNSRFWNRYGIGIAVMGGINMAMYDLLGKLLDLPVYQLLGGLVRSRIRVYASNGLFTTAEPLIADARRAGNAGFDAYKLRVTDPRTVVPIVAAFREALGREMDVMVDAGEAGGATPWSVSISQKIAKALEPYEPLWLEEPVRVENLDGYVEMRQATTVNIAGAESLPTAYAFRPYLERGAFDVVQFDIATSGFTEGARIATLAAVHEKPVAIHSWGTLVSIMAGVHFGLVTPNVAITEYNFTEHPLNELLAVRSVRAQDGHIAAPETPGLGVAFDPALVERFPYTATRTTMMSTEERDLAL
jgi:L-alanine-DL-glutamate epimerase-like enolase superfamily enzyme